MIEKFSFLKGKFTDEIIQGKSRKFCRAAAKVKHKITNLRDNGLGFCHKSRARERNRDRDFLQIRQ